MHLQSLSLLNYKNFDAITFEFDQKFNCLVGNNGKGKTNILDSIYHLSFGKSYFNPISLQNIRHGEDYFMIEGEFVREEKVEKIVVGMRRGQKKTLKRNSKVYDKFSEHIGFLPLVIVSPSDRDLIVEGSEARRKFIDSVISQSDKTYLTHLVQYHRFLEQRNALLKYFAANQTFDAKTLEVYDLNLDRLGSEIHLKRKEFIDRFISIFSDQYKAVSQTEEGIGLTYESDLNDGNLANLLKTNLQKDRLLQYTSVGIHKDDLNFSIEGFPIKKFGSQGQQKTYLIALKLAQFHFIAEKSGIAPILLLDDIFDKLDDNRVSQLVSLVNQDVFGQIFISDTHADRTHEIVNQTGQSFKMIQL
ncbi:MAG: DNA replication and repair protein RecF [Flavobacteriaceae bacterium]|nr:DNA replication and repair protein RecF [Flavobacteriaceae bacterium]MDZ4147805.1 DNA replication and repair protein RecF [Flavobacteriaceae bacterium]